MLNIDKKNFFSAQPLQYLQSNELDLLVAHSRIVSFSPGDKMQQQGKMGEGMYIIIKGEALVYAQVLGVGLINIATLKTGDFVGEVSLIEKGPSPVSVTANTQLECLLVSNIYFDMLTVVFPEMRYKITKAISETVCARLKQIHQVIISILKQTDIASGFSFGEIIKSLASPKATTFEKVGIDPKQVKNLAFFDLFNTDEYNQLLEYITVLKAPYKCPLIKAEEKNTPFYLILCGAVQVNIIQDAKVAKATVLAPVSVFGSTSFIDGKPGFISYTTCERVILLELSLAKLAELQKHNIQLWYKIYDSICKSFVELERALAKLYLRLNSEQYNR